MSNSNRYKQNFTVFERKLIQSSLLKRSNYQICYVEIFFDRLVDIVIPLKDRIAIALLKCLCGLISSGHSVILSTDDKITKRTPNTCNNCSIKLYVLYNGV